MIYVYKAKLVKVIDGDTIDFDIDLGFYIHHVIRVRLLGVDACEMNTEIGKRAKRSVIWHLSRADTIEISTHKYEKGKYGRYLAEVMFTINGKPKLLGDLLKQKGFLK